MMPIIDVMNCVSAVYKCTFGEWTYNMSNYTVYICLVSYDSLVMWTVSLGFISEKIKSSSWVKLSIVFMTIIKIVIKIVVQRKCHNETTLLFIWYPAYNCYFLNFIAYVLITEKVCDIFLHMHSDEQKFEDIILKYHREANWFSYTLSGRIDTAVEKDPEIASRLLHSWFAARICMHKRRSGALRGLAP